MVTNESPLGMTPELFQRFRKELVEACARDGARPSELDIRLKGSAADFFSGPHKRMSTEAELDGYPKAQESMRSWQGESGELPMRWPFDSKFNMGLPESDGKPEPSDFDLNISSDALVEKAAERFSRDNPERYQGDFMGGHGYLDKESVKSALPNVSVWADKWEHLLGRPMSLGVFQSSGPTNTAKLGGPVSVHFRRSDFMIHNPDSTQKPEPDPRTATRSLRMKRLTEKEAHPEGEASATRTEQGGASRLRAVASKGEGGVSRLRAAAGKGKGPADGSRRSQKTFEPNKDEGMNR